MLGKSKYISRFRRKKILKIAGAAAILALLVCAAFYIKSFQTKSRQDRSELLMLWKNGDYENARRLSGILLEETPMDFFFLTIRGYSSFQIALEQTNKSETVRYIDECIFALRKAIQTPLGSRDGRVFYVLGKAYYFKGAEYADSSAKYLEKARESNYSANDMYEYLGLAYAQLGEWEKSIEAFSAALNENEGAENAPAPILLALARAYIALKQFDSAESYLRLCLSSTKDIDSICAARLLLGGIFREREEYREAEKQFLAVLSEAGEIAAAHHELGELYLAQGNTALARSEWRKANRIDPSYAPSIARLN